MVLFSVQPGGYTEPDFELRGDLMNRRSMILALACAAAIAPGCRFSDPTAAKIGGVGASALGSSTSRLALMAAPSKNQLYLFNLQNARVNLQLDTGNTPTGVAVSPSGRQVLVTNFNDGTISTYWREDGDSYTPLGVVGSGTQPLGVAYNPNLLNSEAYVAYSGDGRILVLDTVAVRQRPTIKTTINLPGLESRPAPRKITCSPDGSRIFVTDGANDMIYTITRTGGSSAAQYTVTPSARFPGQASAVDLHGMAALPNGLVFVANRAQSELIVFNGANNQIVGNVPLADRISSTISQTVGPMNIAMNPQRTKMYVTGNAASVVSEVPLQPNGTAGAVHNVPVFLYGRNDSASSPYGVAVTADGSNVYVTNEGGRNISVLNADPNQPLMGSVLFKNIGTFASASELAPLNEIVMVGESVNTSVNPGTQTGQTVR
jgi:DNA-binding beta-propeller fold protein YncE